MKKRFFTLLVLGVLIGGGVFLKAHKSHTRLESLEGDKPVSFKLNVKEVSHAFGEPVWIVPCDIPVVSLTLAFRGCGERSTSTTPGLSDLLSSLLDEGCGPYSSEEFKRLLIEKKISVSAVAANDNFVITLRTTKDNFQDAIALLHLMLTAPRFDPADMERIKKELVLSLQQSRHHPPVVAKETLLSTILGENHPYCKQTQKRIEKLPSISSDDMRRYMQTNFTQNCSYLILAGDVTDETAKQTAETLLKDLPKGNAYTPPAPSPFLGQGQVTAVDMDVPQTFIHFTHPALKRTDPDFFAFLLAIRILGSGALESRLWNEIREKRGLCYFCSADIHVNDLMSAIIGSTATKSETASEIIERIRLEWKKLKEQGITPEELALHKQNLIGAFALNFDSTLKMVSVLMAYRLDGLTIDLIQERNQRLTALTTETVNAAIRAHLTPDLLTFVCVGRSTVTS